MGDPKDFITQLREVVSHSKGQLVAYWTPLASFATAIFVIDKAITIYRADQRTTTWITASFVTLVLIGFLTNVGFSKNPEDSKQHQYPKLCKWARVSLVIVAILSMSGVLWVIKSRRDTRNKVVVVVAELHNAQPGETKAIERLNERLQQQALESEKILIRQPGSAVRDARQARALGEQYGGRLVIWFRTAKENDEDRIVAELEDLTAPSKTIEGGRRAPQTVVNTQTNTGIDQLATRASYLVGMAKYEAEQYDQAIALFDRSLNESDWQRDPVGVGYLYFLRGTCYYFSGKLDKAINDYDLALDGNPSLAQAYFNRGLALSEQKNDERAILDYSQAIRLSPTDDEAYNNRALSYIAMADSKHDNKLFELAIKDLDQAILVNPGYAEAYSSRGDAHSKLALSGESDETAKEIYFHRALADYSKAIDLNPDYAEAYNNRADTYFELKRYDRAIADCTSAVHLKKNYVDAFYNRGRAYFEREEYGPAIEDFSKANILNPDDSKTLYNRAAAYFQLAETQNNGRYYELALADYDKILSNSPDNKTDKLKVHLDRGETFYKLGRCNQASDDFKKALESPDDNVKKDAREWLSEVATQETNQCKDPTAGD